MILDPHCFEACGNGTSSVGSKRSMTLLIIESVGCHVAVLLQAKDEERRLFVIELI